MIGAKYRDRGRDAVNMSSRNISSERRSKSILDGKKPVSTGTLPQKTPSSKDEDTVKSGATKSRGSRGRRFLSRRENKMLFDDVKHKVRLSDETSVASAGNNDPIYILRKEIHDWRVSGQLTDRFERDCRLTEDETEKSSVQENCETVIKDLDPDPDVLHELPSSTAIDHSTRRT
ncbi:uncharacterized protein, partial [Mycetomoellerius zeteki]|uniref:uncharacterized protein n=1 Tax=Mycetomoellerius zeteki TaxID=64791 RepID=UPI00084EAC6A